MKQQKTTWPSCVTLGQAFCDDWNYGNEAERNALSIAAVRYSLTRKEPTPEERAIIKSAWGAVKREIDRIRDRNERLPFVRHRAGRAGAKARWRRAAEIALPETPEGIPLGATR